MKLNRRDTLKLATAGLALPWLGAMNQANAANGAGPKRVLIYIDPYGRYGERTDSPVTDPPWITDESSDYDLTSDNLGWMLAPLDRHLADLSVISGVTMRSRAELGGGVSHAQVNAYTLTGSRNIGNFRNNPTHKHASIHTHIGNELNASASVKSIYDSLTLGNASAYNYNNEGIRTGGQSTPAAVYNALFGLDNTQSLQAQQVVVDQVRKQIGIITPELVQANAATVMDAYQTSIDSISKELTLRGNLSCGDLTPDNVQSAWSGELAVAQMMDAAYDLFSCGLTPSIALGYGRSSGHTWLKDETVASDNVLDLLSSKNYHSLSHTGNDTGGAAQGIIMRGQIAELARLTDRLKITPEIDGSGAMMMDNTVIFYHQAMSAPTHKTNLPYYHFMLAGNNTNVVRGKHFECSDSTDNELWVTLAQAVGLPTTQFGGYKGDVYRGEAINRGPIGKILNETQGV